MNERGVTLIELLITISLIAIVAGFFIPQMTRFSKKQALKATAEELVTYIEVARNKALSSVQGATDPVVAYGVLYFADVNAVGIFRKVDKSGTEEWESQAIDQVSYPADIKIYWPDDPVFSVPTGKMVGGDRTVRVCSDDIGEYRIEVKVTGVVSLGDRQDVATCSP